VLSNPCPNGVDAPHLCERAACQPVAASVGALSLRWRKSTAPKNRTAGAASCHRRSATLSCSLAGSSPLPSLPAAALALGAPEKCVLSVCCRAEGPTAPHCCGDCISNANASRKGACARLPRWSGQMLNLFACSHYHVTDCCT